MAKAGSRCVVCGLDEATMTDPNGLEVCGSCGRAAYTVKELAEAGMLPTTPEEWDKFADESLASRWCLDHKVLRQGDGGPCPVCEAGPSS